MKRIGIILLLLIIPVSLQAQAIGQVSWGSRVFSTGFPASIPAEYFEDGGPKMSKERREIAIRCIEKTFGKVKEYQEYWGDGGLRVGQKLNLKKSQGEWIIRQSDRDSSVYYFTPAWCDDVAYVIVDENGIIRSIHKFTNDC